MKFLISVVTIIATVTFAQDRLKTNVPPAPALQFIQEYLTAFNSSGDDKMRKFFTQHVSKEGLQQVPLNMRLNRFHQMKGRLVSLELKTIVDAQDNVISAHFQSSTGGVVQFEFNFESKYPDGLEGISEMDLEDEGESQRLSTSSKANDKELTNAVSNYLDELVRSDQFSGVVLVAKEGNPIFQKAYGKADKEKNIPNQVGTKFNIGSINKTFTQLAIHQLVAQKKLSLNDPIKKFLPDYPNKAAAEKVTIRHLLNMTSGIGDFFNERYQSMPKEKLRAIKDYFPLFADKPLEFEPGTSNRYSNGGYAVLGAIIEQVSGVDYYSYVREHIFKPANMLETDSYEKDATISNRAQGYTKPQNSGAKRINNYQSLPGRGSSAGGGYSTANDLLKYQIALKQGILASGDRGGGIGISGGAPGLNAALESGGKSDYVIVVLSNYDPPSAENVAQQIRKWLPN